MKAFVNRYDDTFYGKYAQMFRYICIKIVKNIFGFFHSDH